MNLNRVVSCFTPSRYLIACTPKYTLVNIIERVDKNRSCTHGSKGKVSKIERIGRTTFYGPFSHYVVIYVSPFDVKRSRNCGNKVVT